MSGSCATCHPPAGPVGAALTSPRPVSEGHVGVRFPERRGPFQVLLNGKPVERNVVECDATAGWALVFDRGLGGRIKPCGNEPLHPRTRVAHGPILLSKPGEQSAT